MTPVRWCGSRTQIAAVRRVAVALSVAVALWCGLVRSAGAQTPPLSWFESDIGVVGQAGSWRNTPNGFVVAGSGSDIWGPTDSFHFVYQQLNGDGVLQARVASVNGAQPWTKVGLMIRQRFDDPASPHHFLLASAGKGLAYQRRLAAGADSLNTSLGGGTAPVWYRITRSGSRVELSMSADGVNWSIVTTANWPAGPTYIGLAVTSHENLDIAYGIFDHLALTGAGYSAPQVTLQAPVAGQTIQAGQPYTIQWSASDPDNDLSRFDVYVGTQTSSGVFYQPAIGCTQLAAAARSCAWRAPAPFGSGIHLRVVATDSHNNQAVDDTGPFSIASTPGALPAGWSSTDIGAVSAAGSASFDGSTFSVSGSGADIWGAADEFHFAHVTVSGDFSLTARVESIDPIDAWTKAGLMIRENLGAGARHASYFATPSTTKGTAFQRRPVDNGSSLHVAGPALAPPVWIKITKRSTGFATYYRKNTTDPWQFLDYEVITVFSPVVEAGLAVSSHIDGALATARFSHVAVEPIPAWAGAAIGVSTAFASYDQTIFGVFGGGADIWGPADAFGGIFTRWTGDGTIVARVNSVDPTDPWAKAGVMFRESLTSNSRHVFALVSAGRGVDLQYRAATGGPTAAVGASAGAAPAWLRLTRNGNLFTGAVSFDMVNWTTFGSATVSMGSSVWVGMAHTSHNETEYGASRFDDVRVYR